MQTLLSTSAVLSISAGMSYCLHNSKIHQKPLALCFYLHYYWIQVLFFSYTLTTTKSHWPHYDLRKTLLRCYNCKCGEEGGNSHPLLSSCFPGRSEKSFNHVQLTTHVDGSMIRNPDKVEVLITQDSVSIPSLPLKKAKEDICI